MKADSVGKIVTLGSLGLALVHVLFPELAVDAIGTSRLL